MFWKPARRTFLKRVVYGGVSVTVITGCDRDRPSQRTPKAVSTEAGVAPERVHCDDVAGLLKTDVERRKSLRYADHAADPARTCGNCMHLQPVPGSDTPCKRSERRRRTGAHQWLVQCVDRACR